MIKSQTMQHCITLIALALCVNAVFLFYYNPSYFYLVSKLHGNVAYNLYRHNSIRIDPALNEQVTQMQKIENRLIDYADIPETAFGIPTDPFPINDTIGYGVVLGLLWKLTGSLRFVDVQLLQIMLMCIALILFYHSALLLFADASIALTCGVSLLFFFPLFAMNVQPVRDVWAFYGVLSLLYGVIAFVCTPQHSLWNIALGTFAFSICQWVRPTAFLAMITFTCVLVGYAYVDVRLRKKIINALALMWLINSIVFWMPFMMHNKNMYNRYFVGPVGLDLLEGLGEYPNPWGYALDDQVIESIITQKYGVRFGTQEFEDCAKQDFWRAFHENPVFYFKNLFKRTVRLIVPPGLPWIYYTHSPYVQQGFTEKLKASLRSPGMFLDFLARQCYIRLYLLLGYIGLVMLAYRRRYFIVALVAFGVICAGFGKLPSHIEYRYLVPFYWGFAFFVGYAIYNAWNYLIQKRRKSNACISIQL